MTERFGEGKMGSSGEGLVRNGTKLRLVSFVFATVWDFLHLVPWCSQKLVVFGPSFDTPELMSAGSQKHFIVSYGIIKV